MQIIECIGIACPLSITLRKLGFENWHNYANTSAKAISVSKVILCLWPRNLVPSASIYETVACLFVSLQEGQIIRNSFKLLATVSNLFQLIKIKNVNSLVTLGSFQMLNCHVWLVATVVGSGQSRVEHFHDGKSSVGFFASLKLKVFCFPRWVEAKIVDYDGIKMMLVFVFSSEEFLYTKEILQFG